MVKTFVADYCELGPDYTVQCDPLFRAYRNWCEDLGRGWVDRLAINQFSGKLRSAFPGQIQTIRPRTDGTRKRAFLGIRLRKFEISTKHLVCSRHYIFAVLSFKSADSEMAASD
jgi:hypothetical protein